jgi:hypothetical protein
LLHKTIHIFPIPCRSWTFFVTLKALGGRLQMFLKHKKQKNNVWRFNFLCILKCMVMCLFTLKLHSLWFYFIRIYPISFVNKFKFVKYISRWKNWLLMVCTLNIQSVWTIWDEPMTKAYTNEIKFGSYLFKPIYAHIPTYLFACLAYAKLPILT